MKDQPLYFREGLYSLEYLSSNKVTEVAQWNISVCSNINFQEFNHQLNTFERQC